MKVARRRKLREIQIMKGVVRTFVYAVSVLFGFCENYESKKPLHMNPVCPIFFWGGGGGGGWSWSKKPFMTMQKVKPQLRQTCQSDMVFTATGLMT